MTSFWLFTDRKSCVWPIQQPRLHTLKLLCSLFSIHSFYSFITQWPNLLNGDTKQQIVNVVVRAHVHISLLPLLSLRSVHQSPERVSAKHLVSLSFSRFLCLCVCLCVFWSSLCLPALPPLYCVHKRIHALSLSLACNSLSPISVLLGWSPLTVAISGDSCYEKIPPLPPMSGPYCTKYTQADHFMILLWQAHIWAWFEILYNHLQKYVKRATHTSSPRKASIVMPPPPHTHSLLWSFPQPDPRCGHQG